MSYRRCPYAFWLVDSGAVDPKDISTPIDKEAIARGNAFEMSVLGAATYLPEGLTLEEALASDRPVFGLPLIENSALQIYGIPDGVDTADGQLFPIEIKAREWDKQVDYLELAFYYLLLEPFRTKHATIPIGHVILQTEIGERLVSGELTEDVFLEVNNLIEGVRRVRNEGTEPSMCQCQTCATRPEVQERRRLLDIIGISEKRAQSLCEIGIISILHLLEADPSVIIKGLGSAGLNAQVIRKWQLHAKALLTDQPVRVSEGVFTYPENFIVLDLEYVAGEEIWLFGLQIQTGPTSKTVQIWANRKEERRKAVKEIEGILRNLPDHLLVTWNGNSADIPVLSRTAKSVGCGQLSELINYRHSDLYVYVQQHFRLPTTNLGLKSVANYFGVDRESPIDNGRDAGMLHCAYKLTRSATEKERIRQDLLAYNRDDLTSLCQVIAKVAELSAMI